MILPLHRVSEKTIHFTPVVASEKVVRAIMAEEGLVARKAGYLAAA